MKGGQTALRLHSDCTLPSLSESQKEISDEHCWLQTGICSITHETVLVDSKHIRLEAWQVLKLGPVWRLLAQQLLLHDGCFSMPCIATHQMAQEQPGQI